MSCALCQSSSELCESHIIPNFFSRRLRGGETQICLIGQGRNRPKFLQGGVAETLLCRACEDRFQKLESPFARWWYPNPPVTEPIESKEIELSVSTHNLRLLLLSIIWRASVARGDIWSQVNLGPHEPRLRAILLEEKALGGSDYPTYGQLLVDRASGRIWDNVIMYPHYFEADNLNGVRMIFGGIAWAIMTSAHSLLPLERFRLRAEGTLLLRAAPWEEIADSWGITWEVNRLFREADA